MEIKAVKKMNNDLAIQFANDAHFTAPLIWFRYAGGKESSTDQRLEEITQLSADPVLKDFTFEATKLTLTWSDGSEHSFTSKELIIALGDKQQDSLPSKVSWRPDDLKSLEDLFFKNIYSTEGALNILKHFFMYGFVRLRNAGDDPDCVVKFVEACRSYVRETNYGKVFDVLVEPNATHLANSSRSLSAHSDNNYRYATPSVQVLHCLKNEAEGGYSTLVDGFTVAQRLNETNPDEFKTLCEVPVSYQYKDVDTFLYAEKPVIEVMDGEVVGVHLNERTTSSFAVKPQYAHSFFKAYKTFCDMAYSQSMTYSFQWEPGDVLVFNNVRILHGRTGYQEISGKRWLRGCYSDIDGLESYCRYLQAKQNQ